jgi:metallo-beta-lactamase family protein
MHGREVPIQARVEVLSGLSAHADSSELMLWLGKLQHAPRQVYVTHGEPAASDALRRRIQNELGWNARDPEHGETVILDGADDASHTPVIRSLPTH